MLFQSLQTEIENHEPRIMSVVEVGQILIDEGHPQSEEFRVIIEELLQKWRELLDAVDKRKDRLHLSDIAQQVCWILFTEIKDSRLRNENYTNDWKMLILVLHLYKDQIYENSDLRFKSFCDIS